MICESRLCEVTRVAKAHRVKASIIMGIASAVQPIYGPFHKIVIFYNPISKRVSDSHS